MSNNRHFALIMAGGQGSRFWPWSTEERPKQFLAIIGKDPLIKQTFDRLNRFIPGEDIFIVADRKYLPLIHECLPEFRDSNFIDEPCPKNTAPCLILSNIILSQIDPGANLVVAAADHYIPDPDTYAEQVKDTLNHASTPCIITCGVVPTEPHTGYGYLNFNPDPSFTEGHTEFHKLCEFKEKPGLEQARSYIENGSYYWNSGMFFYNLKNFRDFLKKYNTYYYDQYVLLENNINDRVTVERIFSAMEPDSIDFALMEKVKEVEMFKAKFSWNDVGAWSSVYELKSKDGDWNVREKTNHIFVDAKESMIFSTGDKPVAVIGLHNVVVIDTENGLLIADKAQLQKVKNVTQALRDK